MRRDSLFVLLALSLALASPAFAQGAGCGRMGGPGMMGGGPGMMGGAGMRGGGPGMMGPGRCMVDPAGLPALKQKLAITAEQEPQWKGYADAVAAAWDTRQGMRQSMVGAAMTMEERAQVRDTHRQAMLEMNQQTLSARDSLYAVLTPEQRRAFDTSAPARPMMGPPR